MDKIVMIIKFIPAIIQVVKSVEELWPEGSTGKGSEKLQHARELLEAVYSGISDIWPTVEVLISKIVTILNATGVFKK